MNVLLFVVLISVIGVLFCFGEIMGLCDKIVGWVGLCDIFDVYVCGVCDNIWFVNLMNSFLLF